MAAVTTRTFELLEFPPETLHLPANPLQPVKPSSAQSLHALPTEILLTILRRMALFDRCALALTCKFFAEIVGAGRLLRYRSPTLEDFLYFQQWYNCRKWRSAAAVKSLQVKDERCDPFPELAVPPRWFRDRFCQNCKHCRSRFVPKWPYIDCGWGPTISLIEKNSGGQDVVARGGAVVSACRLHPHMPHESEKTQGESSWLLGVNRQSGHLGF